MRIFNWLMKHKKKEGHISWLDAGGTYHFYKECPAIQGKTKEISGSQFLKFELCDSCSECHNTEVHNIVTDMDKSWDSNIKELISNVQKSSMPDTEKPQALIKVFVLMKILRLAYGAMDELGRNLGGKG